MTVTDEDFHGAILCELRRRLPTVDVERIQDVGMSGADDRLCNHSVYAASTARANSVAFRPAERTVGRRRSD